MSSCGTTATPTSTRRWMPPASSGDLAVQKKSYIAMQTALVANPASFFAYAVNFACAYRKSVGGVKTHPMRWFDLRTATLS